MGYKYKIQWLFQYKKDAFKVIRAIGSKSLDIIYLRDLDGNIVDYTQIFIQHPYGVADDVTISEINKMLARKDNQSVELIELVRK